MEIETIQDVFKLIAGVLSFVFALASLLVYETDDVSSNKPAFILAMFAVLAFVTLIQMTISWT